VVSPANEKPRGMICQVVLSHQYVYRFDLIHPRPALSAALSRAIKELSARKLGIPPDRTGAGGMVNTEVLDHTHRDFPRLVPPRRDPVRGRLPPGRPFSFSQALRGLSRCGPRSRWLT